MKIAVLGTGMVGRAIAFDLAGAHAVTCFDRDAGRLEELKKENNSLETRITDLSQYSQFENLLSTFDIVVSAVPGFMGYHILESVIRAGRNVVDISFSPEDAMKLDGLAKEMGVTAIIDCGVAPGMSNLILGRHDKEMKIHSFICYVGGLPLHPRPPFYYIAPFSPADVVQEYIRPARLIENGKLVVKPAGSDPEKIFFEETGELEAFNTDGLRSLVHTMAHIPELKEKTLRYPGHLALVMALKQAGFFDKEKIRIGDTVISPLACTSAILEKEWKAGPDEEEFTVMKVILEGGGKVIEYFLFDRSDPLSHTSSMARTTGYTCTAAVNLLANGLFNEKGVFPPEILGRNKSCFDFVLDYLAKRRVNWKKTISGE